MDFIDARPDDLHIKGYEPVKITPEMLDDLQESIAEMRRQDMKKRDAACCEELAQVIKKHFPELECTGRILLSRLKEMTAAEQRLRESDCPSCGQYPTCHHNHGAHGVVRINCPLWRPKR